MGIEEFGEKYVRIDLFSPKNTNIGTEYIKIYPIEPHKSRAFEFKFRQQNVKAASAVLVDKKEEVVYETQEDIYYSGLAAVFTFSLLYVIWVI